jgi:diguanylate cyclase (GGDEF)-like protein
VLVCAVVLVATVALIPIGGYRFGPTLSFLPAILAAVACFDVMSVWLLLGEYLDSGERRMLVMAVAYLWSLLVMAGYAMAFPGVFSNHPPLATAASVAPYLYIGWHAGFPVLLGAAWAPWRPIAVTDRVTSRARVLGGAVTVTTAAAVAYVGGCVGFIHHLPPLIHGLDITAMTKLTAPITVPLVLVSLAVCGYGIRGRGGVAERWTFVAILVCLCDLILTYASHYRFSLGWYAGRSLTLIAAAMVLVAMLASFRRLKRRAETLAAHDPLTELPNRRAAYDTLAAMLERAERMNTSLSVVIGDLDHFKDINDLHGHAGGDAALRAAAAAMALSLRGTDMIARIGGEEFLILLPDADATGAHLSAERIRLALRNTDMPALLSPVTASFGVATRQPSDTTVDKLVQRADQAMYTAKALGRDRVHSWQPADRPPPTPLDRAPAAEPTPRRNPTVAALATSR